MNAAPPGTFTGRHMLIIMLAFFGVVFTANFTMAYFAVHSWTGLVVKNSYVASQKFNETTENLEKAAQGASASISYANGKLIIKLVDSAGKAVMATDMTLTLGRPSHDGEDQVITLAAMGDGIFLAHPILAKGQWAGEVNANIGGNAHWQRPVRIVVRN